MESKNVNVSEDILDYYFFVVLPNNNRFKKNVKDICKYVQGLFYPKCVAVLNSSDIDLEPGVYRNITTVVSELKYNTPRVLNLVNLIKTLI